MKKMLITGTNSYIGTSLEKWLEKYPDQYSIDTVDMRSDEWKEKDFSDYDVVFHVAGIAHNDSGKADETNKSLYYKVNTELTLMAANKAKNEGVKQFIFMSSIIVYGKCVNVRQFDIITKDVVPTPINCYGQSKLRAEEGLKKLEDEHFKIVILRPPMVYGKGCKGNYTILAKYASKLPIFPDIDNKRSMIYVDNLMEFVRLMVANEERGTFFPQNAEYVKTSEMVRMVAEAHGKHIRMTKCFNGFIKLLDKNNIVAKVFGNLVYDINISQYKDKYQVVDFATSIKIAEG